MSGEIKNFTGVDQIYEVPENPELHVMGGEGDPRMIADEIVAELTRRDIV